MDDLLQHITGVKFLQLAVGANQPDFVTGDLPVVLSSRPADNQVKAVIVAC